MMLMTTVALSFAACENPEGPGNKPGPEVPKAAFTVELTEVTYSSVAYTVTPSDLEAEYLC